MVRKGKISEKEGLNVSCQQSRLFVLDDPVSKEVLVKDLCIAVDQKDILSHAELYLREGQHYVLAGRNGVGKSTLLTAIASGAIPNIPWTFDILLLGQTSIEADLACISLDEETVLQHVLKSDKVRERTREEADALTRALESTSGPTDAVFAFRLILYQRLQRKLQHAQAKAARTSSSFRDGARGLKARKALIDAEAEVEDARRRLAADPDLISVEEMSVDTQGAAEMLTEALAILDMMDASSAESKARTVLRGLGFSEDRIDRPLSQLSGGWKTRCKIACALCQQPDILLLDEPTNFLDLPSIIWLQEYIKSMVQTTVVLVTHDRDFADAVASELLILRNLKLERFRGNLSAYESARYEKYKYLSKMKDAKDKQKRHIESSIQSNIQAAKRTGDDKKLKQAKSRQRKLDDRWGMEKSANGGRFKLNRDRAGEYGTSSRGSIEVPDFDPPVKLNIPKQVADLRFPGALVSLEGVTFAYPENKSAVVLRDISLTIHPGERLGICGLNGSGKSTLVSIVADHGNDARKWRLTAGTVTSHPRLKVGHFTQESIEALEMVAIQNNQLTALTYLMMRSSSSISEGDARSLLSGLGLQAQTVSMVPLDLLSGGQKVRLALAELFLDPPQLLILDEVTTHLDSDTIFALIRALKMYDGALLIVTHDRYFMRCVVEGDKPHRSRLEAQGESEEEGSSSDDEAESQVGKVYRLVKGGLKMLDGGMQQYEDIAARSISKFVGLVA